MLVLENSQNNLLLIASIIILQLAQGLRKNIYLSLMRKMVERQFLLVVPFIFKVILLVSHRSALFLTSLSTVLNCQPLFWRNILLVISILLKKKKLKREEDITEFL